ncbi:DNA repair protein rad-5 [Mucor ambiguus]|uniref:DNA repair protein rad-5 n=1 Tax=Mucor ambiguus TaxID=91626 RepID=A0A0C9MMM8_9FUNG|nr:DNA repair protein rad-5 [Mucor ambiguus]
MSNKRPRDQASIASLKAILGDLPTQSIENLLYRSNNDVEVAINMYFTESQQAPAQPLAAPSSGATLASTGRSRARYYIGDLVITAWSLVKGRSPVKEGDAISIVRDKVGTASNANRIVRFSHDGREVGRLPKDVANYVSVLLDQDVCQFEGNVVWCPSVLKIGEDMILTIRCYVTATGMHSASLISNTTQQAKRKDRSIHRHEIPAVRKIALLQMFRNLGLKPVRSAVQKMNVAGDDEPWDALIQSVAAADANETKTEPFSQEPALDGDDGEEKKAITDDQLDTIYEKAQMFDSQIKPADTPVTMALELKEYQKRALAWMCNKESYEHDDGDLDMRAMHPLWEEYALPGDFADEHRFFYFSPYSGTFFAANLEFPESNKQERGGILADGRLHVKILVHVAQDCIEMGLGKTIEMLSLIHSNRYTPDKSQKPTVFGKKVLSSPTTLIVCPVSLLAQWRDEIIRGSKPDTITVDIFYGDVRTGTSASRLCNWDGSAPDVLITTYGTIMSEWNKVQERKSHESIIFSVEYWRVVLDEAHQIKNKATRTSQACRDIKAKRRWALTGTPIQNKLDDLFALVRYLHYEPWANSTFWKTFITLPFEKQDPSALSAVQTVLEPIVLRRTKAMRDHKGQPMVPLPPKTINIEYLSFNPHEQDIYDAIYNDSQTKFSYYCKAGRVGSNYASIFQLLTRLRQTCCHPYLALQSKEAVQEGIRASQEGGKISLEKLIETKSSDSLSQMSSQGNNGNYGLNVLQTMLAMERKSSVSSSNDNESPAVETVHEEDTPMSDECQICFETVDSMICLPCMHFACRPCVMDYFQKKEDEGLPGECPVCRHGPILQSQLLEFAQQKTPSSELESQSTDDNDRPTTLVSKNTVKYDIQKAVGGYKASTKMNALIRHLRQNKKEYHKTVVFSQFTSFLDLIGGSLDRESIKFTRLDGSMPQSKREKVLADFTKKDGQIDVLLISLRAGGVGLNLTCASRVVMMDPWWNFAIEAQAIDRVHRLGQLNEVVVTRFVMRDSVEERILEIQNRKHVLVNELYMSREQAKNRKLDDLQILFRKSGKL